jgi:type VI secretion system secreted protein VgrG
MAQPYAGSNYGMHFPLHRGTEVLLTFIDGDPDRPVIASSVPNPDTASPVTSSNQTQCMIRTGGNNQIHTEDQEGSQQIVMNSPTQSSRFRLGNSDDSGDVGISMSTQGHETEDIGVDRNVYVGRDDFLTVTNNRDVDIGNDEKLTVQGKREKRVTGKEKNFLDGGQDSYIHNKRIMQVSSGGEEYTVYGGQTQTIHTRQEVQVNGPQTVTVTGPQQINASGGRTMTVDGTETYTVNGTRTVRINGSEDKTISAENGMNLVDDNKMHMGTKNELFIGQKSDIAMAIAIDVFGGLKLATGASMTLQHCLGVKIGREPISLEDAMAQIEQRNMGLFRGALHMYIA